MSTERQLQKIQGVLRYIHDYLEARFEHAARINPGMRRVADDLLWQQLATVHQIFAETKSFGPERYAVIDILTSFDARKKSGLFNTADQNTIFNEIVTEASREKAQKKMEGTTITDIGAFFKAIDPSLESAVLLIESWVWWDLPDAMELFMLDQQAERVPALRAMTQVTPEMLALYRVEMNLPAGELTLKDVVAFEVKRSNDLAASFRTRRASDPGYRLIIKRDQLPDSALEGLIVNMAQRLRIMEQMQKAGLEPPLREHYAKLLRCDPQLLATERAIALERDAFNAGRTQLRRMAESDVAWGEPYNYKDRQLEMVAAKISRIEQAG